MVLATQKGKNGLGQRLEGWSSTNQNGEEMNVTEAMAQLQSEPLDPAHQSLGTRFLKWDLLG